MPELDKLAIKKPKFELEEKAINEEIEKICLAEGDLEERESPEPGDYISGHGIMKAGDTVIHDIPGAVVQVPKDDEGMITGVLVSDFAKRLGKPKAGDEVTIKTRAPSTTRSRLSAIRIWSSPSRSTALTASSRQARGSA